MRISSFKSTLSSQATMASDIGLLLVLAETGPDVSKDEFNDWNRNNVLDPSRLGVQESTKAMSFKATDGVEPTYLTLYNMPSPDVACSPTYTALGKADACTQDKSIISRIACLHQRVYSLISTLTKPRGEAPTFPTKFVTIVTLLVPPGLEEEFNQWYDEEHVPLVSAAAGYARCRRYKLVHCADLGRTEFPGPIPNYLAVYDTDRDDWLEAEECIASKTTPWTLRILSKTEKLEIRRWSLDKEL